MRTERLIFTLLLLSMVILPFLFLTNSCQHEGPSPDEFETICFEEQVLPVFQNSCATCHNGGGEGGLDFSDYSGIMRSVKAGKPDESSAYKAITSTYGRLMPPDNPLPQNKRMIIRLWIEQGAQQTTCSDVVENPNEPPVSGTLWACFERDIQPILQNTCATSGCHDAASHREGVDLSSYSKILNYITPGNPSESEIYKVITKNPASEEFMPPKPYSPLSQAAIDTIYSWIKRGGLNEDCASACDTLGTITYANQIKPMIDLTCVSCHGNNSPSGGIKLLTKSDVSNVAGTGKLLASVKREAGVSPMPPNYALSDCEVRQIELWIEQGLN